MTVDGIVLAFAGGVFAVLVTVLGWIGARLHTRLDKLADMLNVRLGAMNETLTGIEKDLRKDLSALDRRVATLEGGCMHNGEK